MLYDAFGGVLSRTGTTPTPFGFAGSWQYQTDPDSGLQLLGNRYYDPSTGRFISSDPAHSGRNWYTYAANNPLGNVDPSGLFIDTIIDAIDLGVSIGGFINDPSLGGAVDIGIGVGGMLLPGVPSAPIKHIGGWIGDLGKKIGGGIADAWGDLVGFFRPRPKPPLPPGVFTDVTELPFHGGPDHAGAILGLAQQAIDDGFGVSVNRPFPGSIYRPDVTIWDLGTHGPIKLIEVIDTSLPSGPKQQWLNSIAGSVLVEMFHL